MVVGVNAGLVGPGVPAYSLAGIMPNAVSTRFGFRSSLGADCCLQVDAQLLEAGRHLSSCARAP